MLSLDYINMNYSSKYKKTYVKKNFYKKKKKRNSCPDTTYKVVRYVHKADPLKTWINWTP